MPKKKDTVNIPSPDVDRYPLENLLGLINALSWSLYWNKRLTDEDRVMTQRMIKNLTGLVKGHKAWPALAKRAGGTFDDILEDIMAELKSKGLEDKVDFSSMEVR